MSPSRPPQRATDSQSDSPVGRPAARESVGRVVGHVGAGQEDRRRHPRLPADAAEATPISPAELWDALDAVSEPLFVVDRHWRLRYLNGAAARLLSTDRDSAVGEVIWRVDRRLTSDVFHDPLVAAMRERRAMHAEGFVRETSSWIVVSAYPTTDGLLVLQHVADTSPTDDEQRHLLEAERAAREEAERLAAELQTAREAAEGDRRAAEQARVDAEAAARAKSDFLATMSHELRTPINAITGYTQLLELGVAGPVTDAQRGYLNRLHASGRHLLGLVDDVLDLANIERGRMSITRERLTTGVVVGAALALITPEAAARSIRLYDEREGDVGLPFVGDEHRVRQILINLLSNAVKFTPPGGTVAVGCDHVVHRPGSERPGPDGEWVCISVRDTGIGIAKEQQRAIFEPFMQADSSRTRSAGGTGLGLALSRRLARLMGGDLTVESRLGKGSTFTLLLPVAPAAAESGDGAVAGPATIAPPQRAWTEPTPAELAARVREQLEQVIAEFVSRVRADPAFGVGRALSRAHLENHTLSLLGAVLQSLRVIEESGGLEGDLLRDGSAIQEHIAFQHGEQRFRLGWTASVLSHEYAILRDVVRAAVERVPGQQQDRSDRAIEVLDRLLTRAEEVSLRGHEHARRFGRG
ncbi:ATP-binding region ATPase domain protein [Gemmatirosa kalamazoonensis]|uniref:histidine kinase n=1 Tax=Gemmatirosa kalamazoonensis TaxID=861299 RepID=W0RD08_9BACT|nr:ATP-binding protein [Gemmatirosa kalamazoonensis]AHG88676.1 ATP-binding region ATPase domain protein [Gemmatirosa kalamazoonensis]